MSAADEVLMERVNRRVKAPRQALNRDFRAVATERPAYTFRTSTPLVPAAFDLLQRLFNEALVVFLGQIPLDDLGGNHHRQIDRFGPNLLKSARRLELDLALGVL